MAHLLLRCAFAGALLLLSACERAATPARPAAPAAAAEPGSLEWAASLPGRIEPARDAARHPVETLRFFEIEPAMTVVEVLPGRGWYTAILAPYLARGGGTLYAASFPADTPDADERDIRAAFEARFLANPDLYGDVRVTALSPRHLDIAPLGSADLVFTARNVHTFMAQGYAEDAFKAFYDALKPGGMLGVVQHRARASDLQDPQAGSGYVQEEYVKALAVEAGFEFVEASEINANPRDDRDHPFGVWTLPPVLRTAPLGAPADPSFDTTPFRAIGESDRMTLKFRKPVAPPASELRPG